MPFVGLCRHQHFYAVGLGISACEEKHTGGGSSHTLEVDVGVGVICGHHHTCNVWAVPDADTAPAFPCLDRHTLSQHPLLSVPPDAGSLPP